MEDKLSRQQPSLQLLQPRGWAEAAPHHGSSVTQLPPPHHPHIPRWCSGLPRWALGQAPTPHPPSQQGEVMPLRMEERWDVC